MNVCLSLEIFLITTELFYFIELQKYESEAYLICYANFILIVNNALRTFNFNIMTYSN